MVRYSVALGVELFCIILKNCKEIFRKRLTKEQASCILMEQEIMKRKNMVGKASRCHDVKAALGKQSLPSFFANDPDRKILGEVSAGFFR